MALLDEIVTYLDRELKTASITDYPGAVNGLQLANPGQVGRVVAAVDASLPVIKAAAEGDTIIVHEGIYQEGRLKVDKRLKLTGKDRPVTVQ